jgi:hypothetical protein
VVIRFAALPPSLVRLLKLLIEDDNNKLSKCILKWQSAVLHHVVYTTRGHNDIDVTHVGLTLEIALPRPHPKNTLSVDLSIAGLGTTGFLAPESTD